MNKKIKLAPLVIVTFISFNACKQEPSYKLKEPFGAITASAIDEIEDDNQDYFKIPKKFLNKDKIKENERKNEAIKKKLKEARKFDPNES